MRRAAIVFAVANLVRGLQVYYWPRYAKTYGPTWFSQLAPFFAKSAVDAFRPDEIARALRKVVT